MSDSNPRVDFENLRPDGRAHNLLVGERVQIDASVAIGPNVVIHDDVEIGPGVIIKHNAVIGAPPTLTDTSRAERLPLATTRVEAGAMICINAIVMTGATIGPGAVVGDNATLREHALLGERSVIGRGSALGAAARVGARVRIQNLCVITPRAVIEDDVFVGPNVTLTTTDTMWRQIAATRATTVLRRACRIGAGAVLTPNVEVGEEAFIAAGAVVTADVGAREKIKGVPGRVFGSVADDELLENWR